MIYLYKCKDCKAKLEVTLKLGEKLSKCPNCKSTEVSRVFTIPSVHFHGNGFYSTDTKGVSDE